MHAPEDHDCLECLQLQAGYHVETHGLDCGPYEVWWEEWWKCSVCGENYSDRDVQAMAAEAPVEKDK